MGKKNIHHPSHNFLVNYMETFAQDTYWLFGSEACSICRSYEQSNIDGKIDHVGVDEVANQIIHDSNIFAIHMSTPRSVNYAMDLLYAYDGWEDYEQIDKDLYDILKIFQIKNKDYSHRKEIISKLNK
jgi:hypothetical protein